MATGSDHYLREGDESEVVEQYTSSHPELTEWYKEMPGFKNLVPNDQELIKAAMALTLSWKDENDYDEGEQPMTG